MRALFESVTYRIGTIEGIVYSPRRNPMASAMFMHEEPVPHLLGRRHDLINRIFADLCCHSMLSGASVSLMSGATILTVDVAIPSSP